MRIAMRNVRSLVQAMNQSRPLRSTRRRAPSLPVGHPLIAPRWAA
ncbi:hypothetical protein [Streptomyces sp. CdTB01]|nr:hypothetical protein [Streptomyces sp. CdTB01]